MTTSRPLSILVLGGSGIIGRELTAVAATSGHQITTVSRGRHHATKAYPRNVEVITADVYEETHFRACINSRSFDVVVDLLSFNPEHLKRTLSAVADRCEQYILISSATIYDTGDHETPITEEHPRATSHWQYPARKIETEHALREICAESEQTFTIVRPYITYSDQRIPFGAWETEAILSRIATGRRIPIGEQLGSALTSLTHSKDLARGILALAGNPLASDEDFHIVSPNSFSWTDVHRVAAGVLDVPLNLITVPDERMLKQFPELKGKIADRLKSRVFDNSKFLRTCPGFGFEYSIRDGFAQAVTPQLTRLKSSAAFELQGKLDRLIPSVTPISHIDSLVDPHQPQVTLVVTKYLSIMYYLVGRLALINSIKTFVETRLRSAFGSNHYAVRPSRGFSPHADSADNFLKRFSQMRRRKK